ncbi:MAG: bifunctional glycosyltransferase family 2/GtrA family protein [Lachnospiraceae bacterium]|nr:bifunctional glycosyltransferase family 2/GtrA family protein [Lachnospiraceae bacterium]
MRIPVVIPSYEPDHKLTALLRELKQGGIEEIIIVDDGSMGREYQEIFEQAGREGCIVLHHKTNQGKGRALKTAFAYCLENGEELLGVITADSDGQHKVEDIKACMEALGEHPRELILGCRNFLKRGVPARSSLGNRITGRVFQYLVGVRLSDTQTGLRGISREFMEHLLTVKGERFEFETNMLIAAKEQKIAVREVEIETVYIEENKSSHFRPVRDSIRIYAMFGRFLFSSLSSSVVDLSLFALFCHMLRNMEEGVVSYLVIATVLARILSAAYNFTINYKLVFRSREGVLKALGKYTLLALLQMSLSAFLVSVLYPCFGGLEVWVKIPVDVLLFLLSFVIQRELVYGSKE